MKMKNLIMVILVILISTNAFATPVGFTDEDVKKIADPIIMNVIDGLSSGDYDLFSRDFTTKLKKDVSKKRFNTHMENLKIDVGNYVSHSYMGYINQSGYTVVFYKARYEGTADDVFYYLYLSKYDNSAVATGVRWFPKNFNL